MNRFAMIGFGILLGLLLANANEATIAQRLPYEQDSQWVARAKRQLPNLDLKQLAQEKLAAARASVESRVQQVVAGQITAGDVYLLESLRLLLHAELAVATTKGERIAAHERYWLAAKVSEEVAEAKFRAAAEGGPAEYWPVKYFRLDAEIGLVKSMRE